MSRHQRRGLWVSIILLVAFGVRLFGLSFQPLWWDEGFSVYFSTETTARLLELTSLDIHPPLYYLLLQGWYQLVGVGDVQSRLLSVFLGIAALPLAWRLARDLVGNRAAWMTTWLLVLSPLHVYYSQEVRMYSLMTLLTLITVLAWRRRRWVALGIAVLAGLLTQYYFVFLLAAVGIAVLVDLRTRRYGWRGPLLAAGIAVIGYLPWVLYAVPRLLTYIDRKMGYEADVPMPAIEFLPRHIIAWSVGHLSQTVAWVGWGALLFTALAVVAIGVAARSVKGVGWKRKGIGFTTLFWLIPTLGIFAVGLFAPFNDQRIERQLLFVLPFFLMLVAYGITYLWQRWSVAPVILLLVLFSFDAVSLADFYVTPRYPDEDYRPLLAYVAAMQGDSDGWLAVYEWQIGYLRAYLPKRHPTPIIASETLSEDPKVLDERVTTSLAEHPRLWFPAYQVQGRILEEQLADALATRGVTAWDDWYGNTRLYLFGQRASDVPIAELGDFAGVGVVSGGASGTAVSTGVGVVPVMLQAPSVPEDVRVSLQIVGRGSVWGEWDGVFTAGAVRAGIPVFPGTPPGDYEVQASLYDAATGEPLSRSVNGQLMEPEALLGMVAVTRPASPVAPQSLERLANVGQSTPLGGTVAWLGASLPTKNFLQGDDVPITLFWQSSQSSPTDAVAFIQGFDAQGNLKIAHELAPVNGTFPLSQWQINDLVRDPHRVHLPADLPVGDYSLVAGMFDPASGQRLTAPDGQDTLALGTITVQARDHLMTAPSISDTVSYSFGDRAELVQLNVSDTLTAGQSLPVTLVWKSTQTGGDRLRVFVQLYRADTQLYSSDNEFDPPSSAWVLDEYIVDEHSITPPSPLEAGHYRLIVGLYHADTHAPVETSEGIFVTVKEWDIKE